MTSIIASNYRRVDRARHASIVSCTRGPEAGNDPKTRNGTRASVLLFRTRFRGGVREVGKGSRPVQPPPFYENCTARSSCPERSAEICYSHLAINSRYFISNTRSVARGMLRDDRFFFFPDPDSLSSDSRCLHRTMKNSSKKIVTFNLEAMIL